MFDQKPGGIEDIFSDTDAAPVGAPGTMAQGASTTAPPPLESGGASRGKIIWVILGVFVLVVLVGGGLYLALRSDAPVVTTLTPADTETSLPPTTPPPSAPEVTPSPAPITPGTTPAVDTDRDGLSDTDEASYGTNPASADTDSDGLSDADEVRVYQTNPLAPDTDGDSYTDGGEVKAGYNPKGEGRLQDINRARTP